MEFKKYHASILALTVIVLMIRGAVLFYNVGSFDADPDNYRALAENIQTEHVFGTGETPTAFRPPLYPAVLSGVFHLTKGEPNPLLRSPEETKTPKSFLENFRLTKNSSIALTHWILGLLTVFMTYFCGRYLDLTHEGSAFAALLVGIDPILLQQSRLVMTETLAAFFAVLVLLMFLKFTVPGRNALFAFVPGVLLGYAVLCRPAFLLLALLALIPLILIKGGKRFSVTGALIRILVFFSGVAIPLFPWALRNYQEFHVPTPLTTHGGYTLLLANNDFIYDFNQNHRPWEARWEGNDFHEWWQSRTEAAFLIKDIDPDSKEAELFQDELAKSEAKKVIESRSKDFWRSMAVRVGNLWQMLPYQTSADESSARKYARYAVGVFYALEFLLMIFGIGIVGFNLFEKNAQGHRRIWYWIWPVLLIISVQIPHLIFWTNMRMRAPFIAAVALFCGAVVFSAKKKKTDQKATDE